MPKNETTTAIEGCFDCPRIRPGHIETAVAKLNAALLGAKLSLVQRRHEIDAVTDPEDRAKGIEELNQKVGGFEREIAKLSEQARRVARIAREIHTETPRIAKQLGIDINEDSNNG